MFFIYFIIIQLPLENVKSLTKNYCNIKSRIPLDLHVFKILLSFALLLININAFRVYTDDYYAFCL